MCFPLLLVALTIMALLGPGLANAILTLGLVLAVRDSRVVRGAVLGVKANLYVGPATAGDLRATGDSSGPLPRGRREDQRGATRHSTPASAPAPVRLARRTRPRS